MPRPCTLFTGQWADLSLNDLAPLVKKMGYDGVELACWGDHFDVDQAASDKKYCAARWELLLDHGLTAFAISSHLVGQAVCDNIDAIPRACASAPRRNSRSPRRPRATSSTRNPAARTAMISPRS
jgi:sugar phosphate isomerase/epimerase